MRECFEKFGEVKKCVLVMDTRENRSRGFGFVTFDNIEDATRGKEEMNGKVRVIVTQGIPSQDYSC